MKARFSISFFLLFAVTLIFAQAEKVQVITLYDNYNVHSQTKPDWGCSCLVIHGSDTILFDTGNREDIFLYNLGVLGIDIKTVNSLVISHHHGDHTGNVFSVLKANPGIKVFLPSSLEGDFKSQVEAAGGKAFVKSNCKRIAKNIFLSGEMGFQFREQALVIDTKKGLVIIAGCGHPGIDRMVAKTKENFQKKVFLVMGGFHSLEANREDALRMIESFRQLEVKKVAPSHCTGKLTMKLFMDAYQSDFFQNGTGKIIEI